jgi:hypothetical protein
MTPLSIRTKDFIHVTAVFCVIMVVFFGAMGAL